LRFYADNKSWSDHTDSILDPEYMLIDDSDGYRDTDDNDVLVGGLRAMQALSNWEKERENGNN
jgi:hypothetical protein